jgi:hypothetical protein
MPASSPTGSAALRRQDRYQDMKRLKPNRTKFIALLAVALLPGVVPAQQPAGGTVYRCPGNPVLYTDQISAKDAIDRGCRTIEGAPITVMQAPTPRAPAQASAPAQPPRAAAPEGSRIDPAAQRARDGERRAILEAELRREEEKLAELKAEYNNGEPERLGSERNYAKYLERVEQLKASIARRESDIASLKREIGKLPQ